MINGGIIRKIDNLGRIVLPKELRRTMNIHSGDDFKIYKEKDKIYLAKYSRLNGIEENIIEIINSFIKVTKYNIFLIINNKIINKYNEMITNDIIKIINERKTVIIENSANMKISNNIVLNNNTIIFPLVLESDLLGAIIINHNDNINNMIQCVNIINELIKNILT